MLCSMHTEKDFQEKLVDLEKEMNETAKEWLKGEMVDNDKWALAYDDGGYSIKTCCWHCRVLFRKVERVLRR